MTNKILDIKSAIETSKKLKEEGKTIVLAGGCFDILHIGHIKFLKEAKTKGDILFIMLESDETITKLKGKDRPINLHQHRAEILAALQTVDNVIMMPKFEKDEEYDELIKNLKPDTIAATKGDPFREHKERQAKLINAKLVEVIETVSNQSTTKLFKLLSEEFI